MGVLVVDDRGRIISLNRRFISMWGIPAAVIKRRSDDEALGSVLNKLVDPRRFLARVKHLYRHRSRRSSDRILLKDGRVFGRESMPVFDAKRAYLGRVWYFLDVTERTRSAEMIAASENKYRGLFVGLRQAIFVIDPTSGRITDANPAAELLYGYTLEELRRLRFTDLSSEPRKARGAAKGMPARGKADIAPRFHKKKNGAMFPVDVTASVFQANAKNMVLGIVEDITGRLKAQEAVDLKHEAALTRRFIANISHELRTPTTAIMGFAETLINGALDRPRERGDFVRIIHRHAAHLNELIENLLDLACFDERKARPQPRKIDLGRFLSDHAATQASLIRKRGIRLRLDVSASVFILMDESQLRRVVANLMGNAVKYTPSGKHITVSMRAAKGRAVITVTDTGIGISRKDLPLIFNRFYRADTAVSRRIKGTGLGLSLVKEIVKAHGGSIKVESSEGLGSAFSVALPLMARQG